MSEVYYRGDLGRPHSLEFRYAHNDELLKVCQVEIVVTPFYTTINLTYPSGKTESCDLVSPPASLLAGKDLFLLQQVMTSEPLRNVQRIRTRQETFVVGSDGIPVPDPARTMDVIKEVSDTLLAGAKDPKALLDVACRSSFLEIAEALFDRDFVVPVKTPMSKVAVGELVFVEESGTGRIYTGDVRKVHGDGSVTVSINQVSGFSWKGKSWALVYPRGDSAFWNGREIEFDFRDGSAPRRGSVDGVRLDPHNGDVKVCIIDDGGVRYDVPSQDVRLLPDTGPTCNAPASSMNTQPTCDECGGTGEWECPLSGTKTPCTKGCRP